MMNMLKMSPLSLFEKGLLVSLALHGALFFAFSFRWERFSFFENEGIEIDLTRPFRLTTNPLLAKRAKNPGTGAPLVKQRQAVPPAAKPEPLKVASPVKEKDWVLPTPETKEVEKPVVPKEKITSPDGAENGTGETLGGLGHGTGEGEVDWVYLTHLPEMLNREDLARNLRRFYPEEERRAGREGWVVLDVHISKKGHVRSVDVVESSDVAFEEAAQKVMGEARFSSAKVGRQSVPVKIRQTISFQLVDY